MKMRTISAFLVPLGLIMVACSSSDSTTNPPVTGAGGAAGNGVGGSVAGSGGSVAGSGGSQAGAGGSVAGAGGSQAGAGGSQAGAGGSQAGAGGSQAGAGGSQAGAGGATDAGTAGAGGAVDGGSKDSGWVPPTDAGCVGNQRFFYPKLSQRTAPAFPADTTAIPAGSVRVRVMNACPIPLWTQFNAPIGVIPLASGESKTVDATIPYRGRITAFKGAAPGAAGNTQIEFVEMNLDTGALNFNISYVDWVGLPVELNGIKADGTSCGFTACYVPYQNILDGCPTQLLNNTRRSCDAPTHYCGAATSTNDQTPFCKQLDAFAADALVNDAKCAADLAKSGRTVATAGTGSAIFGCSEFWGGSPYCCAKVNRGVVGTMVTTPKENNCAYYAQQPYNPYAFWSQSRCPYVYAFAYDDVNDQSGFQTCAGGRELDITWCPNN